MIGLQTKTFSDTESHNCPHNYNHILSPNPIKKFQNIILIILHIKPEACAILEKYNMRRRIHTPMAQRTF